MLTCMTKTSSLYYEKCLCVCVCVCVCACVRACVSVCVCDYIDCIDCVKFLVHSKLFNIAKNFIIIFGMQ